MKVRYGSEAPH